VEISDHDLVIVAAVGRPFAHESSHRSGAWRQLSEVERASKQHCQDGELIAVPI